MGSKPLLTDGAKRQYELAEAFAKMFDAQRLNAGAVSYRVRMSGPTGLSTGGGLYAGQRINLVPEEGTAALVIGWANPVTRTAELRSFEYLAAVYAARFKGAPFRLDADAYAELGRMMMLFFQQWKFTVSAAALPPTPTPPTVDAVRPARRRAPRTGVAIAVVAALAIGFSLLLRWHLSG